MESRPLWSGPLIFVKIAQSMQLHHIALGSPDVERLAAFYRDDLGLFEVSRHYSALGVVRSIWLELEGTILMIEAIPENASEASFCQSDRFFWAFRVAVDERDRLERHLVGAGHPVSHRTAYSSYFRDPDGNRFGISHYPEPSAEKGSLGGA
jgi:glyoxylase I family protein